ncbi:MAG TPA: heparan-alpha-glucosaminide N-acetyltransferase domain-containing protein [Polyangiaceae bacterium]|jgi:uncharacterized membrane protein|nr:heparan-alpha-glucosaminide N-acetyltransferase domain-containing protein [Polyangiaceae bacterium]
MKNDATGHGPARDSALDTLRGLVMVVMVLDHARDFWHGLRARPLDLATTTADLFLTRWVTHFCAPVFVALAGTSAYLYGVRRSPKERSRFLLTRGLFLVALEVTVIRLLWIPDPLYHFTLLQVIWVIGWSFVVLAGLSRAPLGLVAAFGAILVLGHNALDGVHAKSFGALAPVWNVLHERARLTPAPGHAVYVSYPLVPWIGVMALGYAFGPVVRLPFAERRALSWKLGAALTLGFVLVRAVNGYGDPHPWKPQASALFTVFSFVNVEKYPPSLDYLLMTLGPALLLFAALPSRAPRLSPLATLGRVPLLFYVLHLFLLRYSSIAVAALRFGARAFEPLPRGTAASPELPLYATYLAWLVSLAVLYPVCRAYAKAKAERPRPWMGYL